MSAPREHRKRFRMITGIDVILLLFLWIMIVLLGLFIGLRKSKEERKWEERIKKNHEAMKNASQLTLVSAYLSLQKVGISFIGETNFEEEKIRFSVPDEIWGIDDYQIIAMSFMTCIKYRSMGDGKFSYADLVREVVSVVLRAPDRAFATAVLCEMARAEQAVSVEVFKLSKYAN